MKRRIITSVMILSIFVMSFNASIAISTDNNNFDSNDVIQIYNVDAADKNEMKKASSGYLSPDSDVDAAISSIGDIVINWHDLYKSYSQGFIRASAETEVLDTNGLPEIWKISVSGVLWKNGFLNRRLPSTTYTGFFGKASTSNEDWSPVKGDVYELQSLHTVSNATTGKLEWNVTENISTVW
ncbi:hypothetical protein [Thermotalea metallivorans]|uniref:Uncharacterized protein n=1 Tax=Thermotalea metallivorans TaxID=520762 RepID=A0A140L7D5_9FIRM|nr:hypothetical protein [Thermotalea metallivorans]KXG76460.1 hypothetical protein AN619_09910 [Thermotalea metallivorans]